VEQRASLENPNVPLSSPQVAAILFADGGVSEAGERVTADTALGVPAVWCAVNFLSNTIAALPLQLFKDGEKDEANPLYSILHDAPNPELTSYNWRKRLMTDALPNGGRSYTYIERNAAGRVMNMWQLDPCAVTVVRLEGQTLYTLTDNGRPIRYAAKEIIDIPWMIGPDGITHQDPISRLKDTIGLAIAMEGYASRFFQSGGVVPLQLVGPLQSPWLPRGRLRTSWRPWPRPGSNASRSCPYRPATS
jgi:HK97 family phage portal protein